MTDEQFDGGDAPGIRFLVARIDPDEWLGVSFRTPGHVVGIELSATPFDDPPSEADTHVHRAIAAMQRPPHANRKGEL